MEVQAFVKCPECGSSNIYNNGKRYLSSGLELQRFKCVKCNYRFSGKANKLLLDIKDSRKNIPEGIVLAAQSKTKMECAGINTTQHGLIVEFQWKMKKRQLADTTITNRTIWLNKLVKLGADLRNPESVETVLATENFPTPTKYCIIKTYTVFCKAFKIEWDKIKVHYEAKQPFDPLEEEIDQLIAACGKITSAFLQTLKDTGARVGEIKRLQWTDINDKNGTIAINHPEKGSRTRTVKVTAKTINVLKNLPKKYGNYIFTPNCISAKVGFIAARKRLAERMQNPRLLQIHFHTLRHWRASREYEREGDIYAVKDLLGHKSIVNTDRYQHGSYANKEYVTNRPKTSQEEDELIIAGFEYVRFDNRDNLPIYRKRK